MIDGSGRYNQIYWDYDAPAGRQTDSVVHLAGVSFWLGPETREDVSGKGIS